MLDVLQFIFSNFWTWLGTIILVGVIGLPIAAFRLFNLTIYKPPDKDKKEGE